MQQGISHTAFKQKIQKLVKKFGFWGFMFFLIKGIVLYIVLPLLAAIFGIDILQEIKVFFANLG